MAETPLTNADFRKLLATPRRDSGGGSSGSNVKSTPRREGSSKPGKPKPPGFKAKTSKTEDEDGAKYRDRAEERRRGLNPDYAAANQLLSVIGSAQGDIDSTKLSVEDTKYLGGDLEHTHLVKGLDYALLNKMRSSMTRQASKEGAEGDGADGEGDAAAPAAIKMEDLSIRNTVAKGVFTAVFASARGSVSEQFAPRRTAFVYSLEPEDEFGSVQDIPTTLRRSKADCPPPVHAVFARMDTGVLERIAKIMSYIKTGAGGKKVKKKERDEALGELMGTAVGAAQAGGSGGGAAGQPADRGHTPAAPGGGQRSGSAAVKPEPADAAAEEEDDIFGDAGTDYKPSVSGKKKPPTGGSAQPGGQQAGEADMDLDGPAPGPPPLPPPPPGGDDYAVPRPPAGGQQPLPYRGDAMAYGVDAYGNPVQGGGYGYGEYGQYTEAQQYAAYGAQSQQPQQAAEEPKWRVRTRKAEERMVDFVDDAYGEYYPMAGGFEVPALDEEEEEAPGSKKGAAGADKTAEEPKPGSREAQNRDSQKLNTQLQKIQHVFKEKGLSDQHAGAFTKATPARKTQTGEDPNLAAAGVRKRQRI